MDVKPDYLIDPKFAIAMARRDEVLAEAARRRLAAEARAGASDQLPRRLGRDQIVLALVFVVVLVGATVLYLAVATAGQAPAAVPATAVAGGSDDGAGATSLLKSPGGI
jgi:hypothetical protein